MREADVILEYLCLACGSQGLMAVDSDQAMGLLVGAEVARCPNCRHAALTHAAPRLAVRAVESAAG